MRSALPNFPINEAHNGYLEVYLNLGWVGICLIACLLGTGYRRITSGLRQDRERGALFLGFFLSALYYAFSEAGYRSLSISWFFLLLVIMGASHAVRLQGFNQLGHLAAPRSVPAGQRRTIARRVPSWAYLG
jgi:O-antigen ligase